MSNFRIILDGHNLQTVRPRFYIKGTEQDGHNTNYAPVEAEQLPREVAKTMFGTPVFSNLEIPAGNYLDHQGELVTYEGLTLNSVLFDVVNEKRVVTTEIAGRPGDVKQFISRGDYRITIFGAITAPGNVYPEEDVSRLVAICEAEANIRATSWFLDLFGIDEIMIMSYRLGQRVGRTNEQLFELRCLSDRPFELELSQDEF
jgi:hypothetical protein